MSQLHKRFTSDQVKELLERYLRNEIERKHLQAFRLLEAWRNARITKVTSP